MLTRFWDDFSNGMICLFDSIRNFLFAPSVESVTVEHFNWPAQNDECEYCGMEFAQCGCGKYGISPMRQTLPLADSIIRIEKWLTEKEVDRFRQRWEKEMYHAPAPTSSIVVMR